MRKALWMMLALVLSAAMLQAGGPPDRGGRDRGGRDRGRMDRRRGMFDRMRGMLGRRDEQTHIFEAARQAFELSEQVEGSLAQLENEYVVKELDTIAEVRAKLAKEYVLRIIEILPAGEKAKYKEVMAALDARDEAIAAAKKELREVLDKVKADQGADKVAPRRFFGRRASADVPTSKTDMLRQCFVLSEAQQNEIRTIQREGFGDMRDMMRERMREQMGGRERGGRPDFRAMREVMTKVREEIDAKNAIAMVDVLTDKQKADYQTASAAMDACKKKTTEAEEACKKKLIELLGEEKANAVLGEGPPPQRGGAAATRRRTEF